MAFPTLREMELELQVEQLKAELYKARSTETLLNRTFFYEDLKIHKMKNYKLLPFIEVNGYAPLNPTDSFIVKWRQADEDGIHQIIYTAPFVKLTADAANHVKDQMIRECIYHILNSRVY